MSKPSASIGSATIDPEGTIVLTLRATEGKTVGMGQLVYPRAHPGYAEILRHIGPIKPGEEKPVSPWPDEL